MDPVSDISFTDTLPTGVTIASPSSAITSCFGAVLNAPDGGNVISFSSGNLGVLSSCLVSVDVTATATSTTDFPNQTSTLDSSTGSQTPASATLTVDTSLPGFSKSFNPGVISLGEKSRLTFTLDNASFMNEMGVAEISPTANALNIFFIDLLPPGLEIANPANITNTCTGVLTAGAGSNLITFSNGLLNEGSSCTIALDVASTSAGVKVNRTSDLTSSSGNSGKAVASLDVQFPVQLLTKSFTTDPVPPGGLVTLQFTLTNFSRLNSLSGISFQDNLNAVITGLSATGLPLSDICGAGSQLTGTDLISFSGGSLGPEESCTFDVVLQVPSGADPGTFTNTATSVSAIENGLPVSAPDASDDLVVIAAPLLTKSFLTNPAVAGGSTTLRFTVLNTSSTSAADNIAFTDNITAFIPGLTPTLPSNGFCGPGSQMQLVGVGFGDLALSVTGANLDPGASCTFDVPLQLPSTVPSGVFPNLTSPVTASVGGVDVQGAPAVDPLTVAALPLITKSFTDDPVVPGGFVNLEFNLSYNANAPAGAVNLAFTDTLPAGLTATTTPSNDVCGAGSMLSGTTELTFSGGSLSPGESCTFSVSLQVPDAAVAGSHENQTTPLTGTVLGQSITGNAAIDLLEISGLVLSKSFVDDPVVPGGTATLEFTLANQSTVSSVSAIAFTDDLNNALAGLSASGLPLDDVCGTGSQISGTTTLAFSGGSLAPLDACSFSVPVQVPPAASPGEYLNLSSAVTAMIGGEGVTVPGASDSLIVLGQLSITKSFVDDPVSSGSTVTLEFSISNADPTQTATGISFSDDLDSALTGLAAIGLPASNICGAGSQISGTSVLSFTGGTLGPGSSCTFSVTLQVPAGISVGTGITNVTSPVTGTMRGESVSGSPAIDLLQVNFLSFNKTFLGTTIAGGTASLRFTIDNLSPTTPVAGISFSDDLDSVIPGLVATGLPLSDVCGPGSQISGTGFLTLTNGSLGPAASCIFDVPVQVPSGATTGTFPNTTSELFVAGVPGASPASASLRVEPAPGFGKSFSLDPIAVGKPTTLTFTIDNSASTTPASSLAFADNLPAGLVVFSAPNATTTCSGGVVSAAGGSSTIQYSGGTVAGGAACTVSVDVTGTSAGDYTNTSGSLSSSLGTSGTATDTLRVNPQPGFGKEFVPDSIPSGGVSTLSFTIDNTQSTGAATSLSFTDNLPANVVVANPSNASTTCVGGTLSATPGAQVISYTGGTVGAGSACSVSVDVTATSIGAFSNITEELTSSLGSSGTASAGLTASGVPLFGKAFSPERLLEGEVATLTFTINNSANALDAENVSFTDPLPAGVVVADPPNASTTCTGGTVDAVAGGTSVSYSGGTVAAGATCTVQVDVIGTSPGSWENTTGSMTSSLGSSGNASDTLTIQTKITVPFLSDIGLVILILSIVAVAWWRLSMA